MTISVNNQPVETPSPATLGEVLHQLGIATRKGVAVAVDNAIVPRADWAHVVLSGNENITILQATQGG